MFSKLPLIKKRLLPSLWLLVNLLLPAPWLLGFTPDETVVSKPGTELPDPEFDSIDFQVAWQDQSENLWVAAVDPLTGDFELDAAVHIDDGLAPIDSVRPRTGTGNGPEWVYTSGRSEILYTKAFGAGHSNFRIYRARWNDDDGAWETGELPLGTAGLTPLGSAHPNDTSPMLSFILPSEPADVVPIAWATLDLSRGGLITNRATSPARWLPSPQNWAVYSRKVAGIDQAFLFDADTGRSSQVTTDTSTTKEDVFMWVAPENDNAPLLMTTEKSTTSGRMTIGIYKQRASGRWRKINTLEPPTTKNRLRSAEPAVYNDQSYITFVAEDFKGDPSEIWLAGIRPDAPFFRQLSPADISLARNDPELFALQSKAVVYYTILGEGTLLRSETGLGPRVSQSIAGTSGKDTLVGTSESERFVGGAESDTITGGQGYDLYVYEFAADSEDFITDFEIGQDLIDVTLLLYKAGYRGADPIADGYLLFVQSGPDTRILFDPDGDSGWRTAELLTTVQGVDATTMSNLDNFVF
jgi:hypothetical protein